MSERDLRQDALLWLSMYRDLGIEEIRSGHREVLLEQPGADAAPADDAGSARPGDDVAGRTGRTAVAVKPGIDGTGPLAGDAERIEAACAIEDPAAALERLRDDVIGDCRRCRLCEGRTKLVFGVGNARARLVFVGEGPGADEDIKGEPFVGRAGQLLDKIIVAMGLRRADVYIGNVVKCRPPENRAPLPDESATCRRFLAAQIRIIRPDVVVALGKTALEGLTGETVASITRLRGQWMTYEGIPLMVTFHPAYLLRNPPAKRPVWEDMQNVLERLGLPVPSRGTDAG